jgi:hypothetical protein
MVLRINHRETQQGMIVELHGWFGEDVLGEFDGLCGSIPGPMLLDLSNLTGADEAGLRALRCRGNTRAPPVGSSGWRMSTFHQR